MIDGLKTKRFKVQIVIYLFRGPLDQTVSPLIFFTIETNRITLTERTTMVQQKTQITHNKDDHGMIFNDKRHWRTNSLVRRTTEQVRLIINMIIQRYTVDGTVMTRLSTYLAAKWSKMIEWNRKGRDNKFLLGIDHNTNYNGNLDLLSLFSLSVLIYVETWNNLRPVDLNPV